MPTSDNVLLVSPKISSAIEDAIYYLSDSDLILQFPVETAFLVEGRIDIRRLVEALEDTLGHFPLFCGQFIQEGQKWGIFLANRPIELEVVQTNDLGMLPNDAVLQDPWLYSPPLDMNAIIACKNVPLLKMRLIVFESDPPMTTLGASSAHVVGDGSFLLRFWRLLSQNYQCLPPLDPYPIHSRAIIDETCSDDNRFCPMFPQLIPRDPQPPPPTHRTTLFFSLDQLHSLQGKLSTGAPPSCTLRLSVQDCVTALISVAYSRSARDGQAVNRITNVFNLRGGIVPVEEPLNALSWINAITHDPYDVVRAAFAIREGYIEARDPSFQAGCVLAIRQLLRKVALGNGRVDFTPPPGSLLLNSSWKFDYTSAHFGFGEQKAHFLHTVFTAPRYAKMFRRNPSMPVDRKGQRMASRPTDGIEWTFYLLPEDRKMFLKCLQGEWLALGMRDTIEVLSPE